ncbi:M48 family metallopeptidase [Hymenobacter actinosclerus]|uniref:Zn-dependent protease with chaperone function n=1 Tax=Hymenobacter actinosclerus TaxID=82805 RepID=A0A1H9ZQI6_9BACT|nr:M48 family metallopeptidase [Hymenobacter actinosclerus]SES83478.1 Zn-dependent protease with chaperone function [Hymenobacter actinosclerus]
MDSTLYPPSPTSLPAGITASNARYRLLIAAMMGSILLFLTLYFTLLAGALWLVYLALTLRFDSYGLWTALLHLGIIGAAGMVVAFLVKFLFKAAPQDPDNRYLLAPEAHPELFGFVRQLCAESGADMPKHIYVNGEVNASVSYDSTWRSLFWPTRKNLLIGLGLVNGLTLSEFKAVLAHEFGHFAQRSMKLGSYTHTTSRIIHDMVFERDAWDEMLAKWRALDLRISAAAWGMTGMVWVVRKVLELAYQGIHLVHASLSREMEFEADRMAVRLTGSEAICQALYQLGPTSTALQQALSQLGTALEHKLATDDIFYHQSLYLKEQLAERSQAAAKLVTAASPGRRFAPDEVQVVAMYSSHPDDYLREERALAFGIPGPTDDRSPWLLFGNPPELRRTVTHTLYPEFAPTTAPTLLPAAEVEEFLRAERAELTYHPQYAGSYDIRLLTLLDPASFAEIATTSLPDSSAREAHQVLFGQELPARAALAASRRADLDKLSLFEQKLTKDRQFTVAGVVYPASEAPAVAARLQQEQTQYAEWLAGFDRQSIALHWQLSAENPAWRAQWLERYQFQFHIQQLWVSARDIGSEMQESLDAINKHGSVSEEGVQHYQKLFEQRRQALLQAVEATRAVLMMPLTHLQDFPTLHAYIMHKSPEPGPVHLTGEWLDEFMGFLSHADDRLNRLYFKNLGVLLRLQEELVRSQAEAQAATTANK